MKIYCLFSVSNDYNQPPNNLECFWSKKPTIEQLGYALGLGFPCELDDNTMKVVNIWKGTEQRIDEYDYRLESFKECG